jgi:hypothetical protein
MILPLNLAFADGSTSSSGSEILNGQVDLHTAESNVSTSVVNAEGNVAAQSSAGGNNLQVVTMNDTGVLNNQYTTSIDISANLSANVQNSGGTVTLQSQAICNGADVSTDPHITAVNSSQECDAVDPSASVNANVVNAGNDVSIASTAMGNSFSEDTNATQMPTQNYQLNQSSVNSTVNAKITNVAGNVTVNSTAMGNNAQIIGY